MNLDALVNELQDSKNRVFADEIFAQLDLLDQAKAELLVAKTEHKTRFENDSFEIINEREKYISLNKGFRTDHKNLIKDYKYRLKKQLDEGCRHTNRCGRNLVHKDRIVAMAQGEI